MTLLQEDCSTKNSNISLALCASASDEDLVKQFLSSSIPLDFPPEELQNCMMHESQDIPHRLIEALLNTPLNAFPQITGNMEHKQLSVSDIPQFSNMATAMFLVPKILHDNNESYTYGEIGYLLHPCKTEVAAKKYGENQAKLTMMLGLASSTIKYGKAAVYKSLLTDPFYSLEQSDKINLVQRLCFKIPLIQQVSQITDWQTALNEKLNFLSESMLKRRKHCCVELICFALGE